MSGSNGLVATTSATATPIPTTATTTPAAKNSVTRKATVGAAKATTTASSTPRPKSPQCYRTNFVRNAPLGRPARLVVMNVYTTLREECPYASYRDIVRQTSHLTGVTAPTIFRWKRMIEPPAEIPKKRRKKQASPRKSKNARRKKKQDGEAVTEESDGEDEEPNVDDLEPECNLARRKKKQDGEAVTEVSEGEDGEPNVDEPECNLVVMETCEDKQGKESTAGTGDEACDEPSPGSSSSVV